MQARYASLAEHYRRALLEDVVPFWQELSLDREYGGYLTFLDRDGSVYGTDKMMWLQWREVWMFSVLYREVEARPEWLEAARLGHDFLLRHGRHENGNFYFLLARDGTPLVAPYNIFSDFFAVMGLAQYGAAAGNEQSLDLAHHIFARTIERMPHPKGPWEKRMPTAPPALGFAATLILLSISEELHRLRPDPRHEDRIDAALDLIRNGFYQRHRGLVFETITPDRRTLDTPEGRTLNPGHAVEAMWFVLETARRRGDGALAEEAADIMLRTLETGWDDECGGLFYFLDSEGRPPEKLEWSMKLWWPHLEGLYGLLLAHHLTGREECWNWYEKVHDYAWNCFPDPEYGEWFGYLDRSGSPTHLLKGGKWKGFFHVPRALYLCWKLLEERADEGSA